MSAMCSQAGSFSSLLFLLFAALSLIRCSLHLFAALFIAALFFAALEVALG
jgi:hypothetical protein